jgi:hypothetical protein
VVRVAYGRIEVIHRARLMALAGVSDSERAVLGHLSTQPSRTGD